MTDVSFSTKLTWFAPESDTVEMECEVCGNLFEPARNQKGRAKYCPGCRDDAYNIRKLNHHNANRQLPSDMGDPSINLVYGMVRQALADSDKGDRDAKQWLVSDLELWLRACGLSLRPSERMRIRRVV